MAKIIDKERFEIGIHKSGKVYWKPEWCVHIHCFHKVENGRGFKYINTWTYYIPTTIQLFWLKFIFYIKLKPKLISGDKPIKYVEFDKTHLSLMDLPEGSWSDG
jgi:hypothetical protein